MINGISLRKRAGAGVNLGNALKARTGSTGQKDEAPHPMQNSAARTVASRLREQSKSDFEPVIASQVPSLGVVLHSLPSVVILVQELILHDA